MAVFASQEPMFFSSGQDKSSHLSISFESMANLHYITIFLHIIHFLQSFAKMHERKSAE